MNTVNFYISEDLLKVLLRMYAYMVVFSTPTELIPYMLWL